MMIQQYGKIFEPTMAKEDVVKPADEVISDLELEDHISLASTSEFRVVDSKEKQFGAPGWCVTYTLKVAGVRMLDKNLYDMNGQRLNPCNLSDEVNAYKPRNNMEFFKLYFQDGVLVSVEWSSPQELVSVENPAVELMSFDKIKERVKKLMSYCLSYAEKEGEESVIVIDEIILTYLKVDKANSPSEFYFAPVWCLVSNDTSLMMPCAPGVTFINAVDGTFMKFNW